MSTSGQTRRFFIAGCQRTGTTLMRLVLECHSKAVCLDEGDAYLALAGREFPVPEGKDIIGFKIPRWTEQLCEPRIADYGMALPVEQFYAGDPIIFMLRDVRDVAVSMMRLRQGKGTWLETWGVPTIEFKIATSGRFRERFAVEIEQIRSAKSSVLAAYAALYWKFKTLALDDYVSKKMPVLPVRYEDLVAGPQTELVRVIEFLQLDWEPQLLDHPKLAHGELDDEGKTIGGTDPTRPIDSSSVKQWQHELLPDEIDTIMAIAGDVYGRIYGENPDNPAESVTRPIMPEVERSLIRARLSDREQSVCALSKQLAEQSRNIQALGIRVVERQQAADAVSSQLVQQTNKVNELTAFNTEQQKTIAALNATIESLTGGKGGAILQSLRRARAWLAPPGTVRDRAFRFWVREGTLPLLRRGIYKLQLKLLPGTRNHS